MLPVDAPSHFLSEGVTIDQLALDIMIGEVSVIELLDVKQIDATSLGEFGIPEPVSRVLFKTSNSEYWRQGLNISGRLCRPDGRCDGLVGG